MNNTPESYSTPPALSNTLTISHYLPIRFLSLPPPNQCPFNNSVRCFMVLYILIKLIVYYWLCSWKLESGLSFWARQFTKSGVEFGVTSFHNRIIIWTSEYRNDIRPDLNVKISDSRFSCSKLFSKYALHILCEQKVFMPKLRNFHLRRCHQKGLNWLFFDNFCKEWSIN